MKNYFTPRRITFAASVAALYMALTMLLAPISFGPLQFRVSEALCILPFFFPSSVMGLFIGCMLANMLGGFGILDIVFGSLATLLAALCTMKIRVKWLACLPPVLINGVVIGAVLAFSLTPDAIWTGFITFGAEVTAGQLGVLYLIGLPLIVMLPKFPFFGKLCEMESGGTVQSRL